MDHVGCSDRRQRIFRHRLELAQGAHRPGQRCGAGSHAGGLGGHRPDPRLCIGPPDHVVVWTADFAGQFHPRGLEEFETKKKQLLGL